MDHRNTSLFQDFKPLLTVMKLCGLYHTRHRGKHSKRIDLTLSQCYSLTGLLIWTCNTIRVTTMFSSSEQFGYVLFMKIVMVIWYFSVLIYLITYYQMCKILPQFFVQWQELQHLCGVTHSYRKQVTCITVVCLSAVFTNAVYVSYSYYNSTYLDLVLSPYKPTEDTVNLVSDKLIRFVVLVLNVFGTILWLVPLGFYTATCES